MREIDKVLDASEKILWEGKPQFLPFILGTFVRILSLGLVAGLFGYYFAKFGADAATIRIGKVIIEAVLVAVVLLVGYGTVGYFFIWYAITNKRVIFQSGIIGRDFGIVDYDKINDMAVMVGIIDKVFGKNSGNISISGGRTITTRTRTGTHTRNVPFFPPEHCRSLRSI